MFDSILPIEFLIVRKDYLEQALAALPEVRSGRRGSCEVYRLYEGDKNSYREVSKSSARGQKLGAIYAKRCRIGESLSQIKEMLSHCERNNRDLKYDILELPDRLDASFFDNLEDSSCTLQKKTEYYFDGRYFRSRAEMFFATFLKELGLEYKYDVTVTFNDRLVTYDFAIVFREYNRCVLFEYYGKCQDPWYVQKNMDKMGNNYQSGIYLGRDVFVSSGDENYMPGPDLIRIMLAGIIALVTKEHVVVK